jgi:outer membrane immunogenic protein
MRRAAGWAARAASFCAALGALAGGTASAADMGTYYTAVAPLRAYSWTGPYLGGNLGYTWGSVSNNPTRPSGFVGGVTGGYNWEADHFVFGGEADIQLTGASDTFATWKFSNPWFGTARARAGFAFDRPGYAFDRFLVYGTAGFAAGELQAETVGFTTESHFTVGWTAGAGIEAHLVGNWSAKLEYLFVDFSGSNFALTGTSNGLTENVFRAGINYHF